MVSSDILHIERSSSHLYEYQNPYDHPLIASWRRSFTFTEWETPELFSHQKLSAIYVELLPSSSALYSSFLSSSPSSSSSHSSSSRKPSSPSSSSSQVFVLQFANDLVFTHNEQSKLFAPSELTVILLLSLLLIMHLSHFGHAVISQFFSLLERGVQKVHSLALQPQGGYEKLKAEHGELFLDSHEVGEHSRSQDGSDAASEYDDERGHADEHKKNLSIQ